MDDESWNLWGWILTYGAFPLSSVLQGFSAHFLPMGDRVGLVLNLFVPLAARC